MRNFVNQVTSFTVAAPHAVMASHAVIAAHAVTAPHIATKSATYTAIKDWSEDDKPREKLINKGTTALSDSELLAILLNNGSRMKSAIQLAQEVLDSAAKNLGELSKKNISQLKKIKGIGTAKAVTIIAAMELSRRRQAGYMLRKTQINSGSAAALYFKPLLADLPHESFHALYLNNANRVLLHRCISQGGINSTPADCRIIFREALEQGASKIIFCHNHPSGNLTPSHADIQITKKFKEAGHLLDIQVIDHIIVSEAGYYSMAEEGFII